MTLSPIPRRRNNRKAGPYRHCARSREGNRPHPDGRSACANAEQPDSAHHITHECPHFRRSQAAHGRRLRRMTKTAADQILWAAGQLLAIAHAEFAVGSPRFRRGVAERQLVPADPTLGEFRLSEGFRMPAAPACESLQGRKPREQDLSGTACAMGIRALPVRRRRVGAGAASRKRATSSGLKITGALRSWRKVASGLARSARPSVTLKKNRSAETVALIFGVPAPLVGRVTDKCRKLLNPLHVVLLGLRRELPDRHVFDHAPTQRADNLLGHGDAPVLREVCKPLDLKTGPSIMLDVISPARGAPRSVLGTAAGVEKAVAQARSAAPGGKPNIIVIMGDDVGWFNIGAYHRGIMSGKTPNLDKLAADGMIFTDYYAEASCTAGRANFITGEIPLRTGLTTVGQAGADVGMPDQACTIATALKALGYATGQFGKNHLGDKNKYLPTLHGFDEFFGYLYHLDAMSDPYWFDYPQDWIDKYGPRNLVHCYATETDDPTDMPRWGRSASSASSTRGR